MSSLTQEQKDECEKIFKFLDKDQDNKLSSREIILGLGVLGKVCTMVEQKNIRNEHAECDLDTFFNICSEKVNFKNTEIEMVKSVNDRSSLMIVITSRSRSHFPPEEYHRGSACRQSSRRLR